MMKMKRNKLIFSLIAGLLAAGLVVGGTIAFLSTKTEKEVNVFSNGVINVEIEEKFEESDDGYIKEVRFLNDSQNSTLPVADNYVRAKVVLNWVDEDGSVFAVDQSKLQNAVLIQGMEPDWQLKDDGYFYYKNILKKDQYTSYLMKSVKVDSTGLPKDGHLEMNILVDAVQAAGSDDFEQAWKATNK